MRCEGQIRLWLLSEKKKKKKDHLYLCFSFRCGCIHYHYSKPQYHQCLVFPSQIQSPAASLTLSFWSLSRELNQANKQKSREQIKMFCISESEADPAVGCLFTAVRDDLCGFFFPFYLSANDYVPSMLLHQLWWASISLSPMCAWEILSVISNLFGCQTSEQRNIKLLRTHCGGRSSITSQSRPRSTTLSFSSLPSPSPSPFSPSQCPCDAIWGSQQ